jgi:predicted DNA-binding protein
MILFRGIGGGDMEGPTKNLGIRIPVKLLQKLQYIAQEDSRSTSGMVRFLIYNCVEEFERSHGTIDPP